MTKIKHATREARAVSDVAEDGHTGFTNSVVDSASDTDFSDNMACVPLVAILLDAFEFCDNDVPWINYSLQVFGIDGVQPGDISYSWINVDNSPVEIPVDGPAPLPAFSGYLIWPGATADGTAPGANGTGWPGWTESPGGQWVSADTL